jgi:hypothetical protein
MRLVDKWKNQLLKNKCKFAKIQTAHAIFDLAAIIVEMENLFTIQYPKVDSKGGVTIGQENIARGDIVDMRYYVEG